MGCHIEPVPLGQTRDVDQTQSLGIQRLSHQPFH